AAHAELAPFLAEIADVIEQIAGNVLPHRRPEMRAEPPIDNLRMRIAVFAHRKAAQHEETAARMQLGEMLGKNGRQTRQRKIVARDLEQRNVLRKHALQRVIELVELGL